MDVKDNKEKPQLPCLGARHVQSVLLFLAMVISFCMRVNMSMAIVAMTDETQEDSFDWSIQTQSVILSSFFWGYIVLQVPAGILADKFGGKWLVFIVVFINSLVSLLLPMGALYGGWQLVCGCRVLQGLSQGLLWPSMHNLISKWIPLEEKSRLATFIYAGCQLGTASQLLASGFIADYLGWQSIFYVDAFVGLCWSVVYFFIGADSPQNSKIISEAEKFYIQNSLGQVGGHKKLPTPWKKICTSVPFLALLIMHCGHNWGFWTLMTEMPSYMKQVLGVDIKANGVMSAIPYITMWCLSFPFGYVSDLLIRKKWLSITATRKLSNTIGEWGPAIALIGFSYAPAGQLVLVVVMLSAVVGLNAGHMCGFLLVHIDMAPNFGGNMMGITNFFANIVSIVAPLVAGLIIVDETNVADWRTVFFVASGVYVVTNLIFLVFATSEVQPWNTPDEDTSIEEERNKTEKVV